MTLTKSELHSLPLLWVEHLSPTAPGRRRRQRVLDPDGALGLVRAPIEGTQSRLAQGINAALTYIPALCGPLETGGHQKLVGSVVPYKLG